MKTMLACDQCGVEINPDQSFYDIGSEMDFCERHYCELQLRDRQKKKTEYLLKIQYMQWDKIDPLSKQIDELKVRIKGLN